MASELRVNKLTNRSGLGTVTYTDTGAIFTGIITATSFSGPTGHVSIADKIIHTGDTDTAIRFPSADTITAETGGSERFRIDSSGDVGINIAAPVAQLQVNTTKNAETDRHDATNYALALRNPNDNNGEAIGLSFGITSNTTKVGASILHERDGGGSQGSLQFYTSGDGNSLSERLRIASDGKVRIGSGDPYYNLEVQGSGQQTILIGSTNAGGAYLTLDGDSNGDGSGGDYSSIGHNTSGNLTIIADNPSGNANMLFTTGDGNEKMRLDSSGRLLLAATSGTARFHIKGNGGDGIKIENSGGTNGAVIDLKNTLTNYVQEYRIAVAGSDGAYGTAKSLFVRDQTSGANRFEVQAGGDVKVSTGNLLIGTAGKGVNFSAFATSGNPSSNLLDDYEEGIATFTLYINGGAWSGVSYSYNTAPYVKVGRMVYCAVSMFATNLDGTTGSVSISGLPFTDGGGGGYREPAFLAANHSLGTSPSVIFGAVAGSSSIIALRKAGAQDLNGSDIGGSFWMHGSLVYMANA